MSFRRIEVTLPSEAGARLCDLLDDSIRVLDAKAVALAGEQTIHVLLVEAEAVEPIIDAVCDRFEDTKSFRLTVSEILTLVPEPKDEDVEQAGKPDDKAAQKYANRIAREELLEELQPGTRVNGLYLVTTLLSSIIATIGLIEDSPAVVIGAMMIAPLLLPNMSLALGTTLGHIGMVVKSLLSNGTGVALSLGLSILLGYLLPFDKTVDEITARTSVDYLDIALALAAGTAGAVAVSTGVSANLIGVMVAVALLPPLVAFGLLIGAGDFQLARGAGLMSAINIICVNLAAVCTFLVSGIRPNRWHDEGLARKATIIALVFWLLLLICVAWLLQLAN